VERGPQPAVGGERELLGQWLHFQRETLALKAGGLDPAALVARPVPPSTLSLARILRHLTDMEHMDGLILTGQAPTSLYVEPPAPDPSANDPAKGMYDWSLYDVDDDPLATWREQCANLDTAIDAFPSLDDHLPGDFRALTLRSVVLALVVEYARHNGHADLLRQLIDGRVGY
jgi:Protein of unknown function (DUF664)